VRVVQAGDYSTEFCGGTHVPSTGQIGPLILISEGSVAANTRRVEALTGTAAYQHLSEMRRDLEATAGALNAQPSRIVEAAEALTQRLRDQEERIAQFEDQARADAAGELLEDLERHGDHALLVARHDGSSGDALRALAFQVRDRVGSGIGVLGSQADGKGTLVAFVSEDLIAAGVSAGTVIAEAARTLGGGGSRDPRLAQAGGPNGDQMPEALEAARTAGRDALRGL
jgi:alanyl-tRNA synthetase